MTYLSRPSETWKSLATRLSGLIMTQISFAAQPWILLRIQSTKFMHETENGTRIKKRFRNLVAAASIVAFGESKIDYPGFEQ